MITYTSMTSNQVNRLMDIDRSEYIDLVYEMRDQNMVAVPSSHECPQWEDSTLREIQERFIYEVDHGGTAVGAWDGDTLVGFGVLAHRFRGKDLDQLQIDLMYVSRPYRRRGIGTQIMDRLSDAARARGAKHLYISSTETRSAVTFYQSAGSQLASEVDEELYRKEPLDIHMIKPL